MRIISFSDTTEALLAGRKTVTRRQWKDTYAKTFHEGEYVQAYNKNPRNGGKPVAIIQLTQAPYLDARLLTTDWEAEGFAYMEEHGLTLFGGKTPRQIWEHWQVAGNLVGFYVVNFRLVKELP